MHGVRANTKRYSTGAYQYAQVCFKMERDSRFYTLSIVIALLLVVATYSGLWVSPAAAPGRIALAFLCFLARSKCGVFASEVIAGHDGLLRPHLKA